MSKQALKIIEALAESASGHRLDDVRIGLRYTGVRLDDGSIGVSYNFPENRGCDGIAFPGQSELKGREASEVLSWLISENQINRSLALAVANGLTAYRKTESINGDIRKIAQIKSGDRVTMVGYFRSIADDLSEFCDLKVYDKKAKPGLTHKNLLPAEDGLRDCDVALITATAFLNGTIESLLEAASNCREVAILGPSTPLVPEAFVETPVTLLSGVFTQNEEVLRVISEGGGMQSFRRYIQKANFRLK
ncbi:MAG: DUF364 domain-containing protein [Calditrichaeota bacterium]|nr:DUF364 domain-containing protein [Calditrichota bacterium]